jgi:hypothetical protein
MVVLAAALSRSCRSSSASSRNWTRQMAVGLQRDSGVGVSQVLAAQLQRHSPPGSTPTHKSAGDRAAVASLQHPVVDVLSQQFQQPVRCEHGAITVGSNGEHCRPRTFILNPPATGCRREAPSCGFAVYRFVDRKDVHRRARTSTVCDCPTNLMMKIHTRELLFRRCRYFLPRSTCCIGNHSGNRYARFICRERKSA